MKSKYNVDWIKEKFESGEALEFIFFWGHTIKSNDEVGKNCLSQWFNSPFQVENIIYKTAEHWMMAQKALLFGDKKSFQKIISCDNPVEVKEIGRQILYFDEKIWNENKYEIVKNGNIHKFNQSPKLANFLLQTETQIIVEASPFDKIWGIGLSQDDLEVDNIYAWPGENLLGFALMEVRDFLKQFGHFETLIDPIKSPWSEFPKIDIQDMFWRMGKGEDCLMKFINYYTNLPEREKIIYRLTNPTPPSWEEIFE